MCGIIGIVASTPVNQDIYDALTVIQHRGQDAAGIATCHGDHLYMRKNTGLVRDVFLQAHMASLMGNMGIGHLRYPTAGSSSLAEAQPFYVNSPFGITLAHNGNLTNTEELKHDLFREDRRHINTTSDSEVLLNVLAHELACNDTLKPEAGDIFEAISAVHKRCRGAYAVVAMITNVGIVGFRDPYGIRPVIIGKRHGLNGKTDYMIASESVALDALDFEIVRDIEPGEAVFINTQGELFSDQCAANPQRFPCIFEHVYFARPDSILDDISVYKARLRMGQKLAAKLLKERPDHEIDVIIPIPDTSRTTAMEMAQRIGVKFREGLIKNRYIGRTFIMPHQEQRAKSVRQKLNAIDLEFRGKNVMLVDDSIVRGTTCKQIIQIAREAGARQVYFASAAPPVRHQNVYGIDMPVAHELIAHGRTDKEVEEAIGADWLLYQELDDLIDAVSRASSGITQFDTSCFDGHYVTGDINQHYLEQLELIRSDSAKEGPKPECNILSDMNNYI